MIPTGQQSLLRARGELLCPFVPVGRVGRQCDGYEPATCLAAATGRSIASFRMPSARSPVAGRCVLRYPEAVRPWQHVLDAVQGLLVVAQEATRRQTSIGPWNIGPLPDHTVTVGALGDMIATAWGGTARVTHEGTRSYPETHFLAIDGSKARAQLGAGFTLEPGNHHRPHARVVQGSLERTRCLEAHARADRCL